jgi:hypothetical protein
MNIYIYQYTWHRGIKITFAGGTTAIFLKLYMAISAGFMKFLQIYIKYESSLHTLPSHVQTHQRHALTYVDRVQSVEHSLTTSATRRLGNEMSYFTPGTPDDSTMLKCRDCQQLQEKFVFVVLRDKNELSCVRVNKPYVSRPLQSKPVCSHLLTLVPRTRIFLP